jgi:chloramphenicol-sensitive protein RarD
MDSNRKHYIAAISAFAVWGFFSIPLRALKEYEAGEILYFRILFSAVILLAVILLFRKNDLKKDLLFYKKLSKPERKSSLILTLFGGALLCVNWLTFIYIVNNINIKTASFSYLICPVITAILGFVLIKEKLSSIQWISVGFCTLSCLVMGISSVTELAYSFLTALTYAIYLITQRKNQGFDRLNVLGVQVLFSLILLTFLYKYLVLEIPTSKDFYLLIFLIAVVFTVVPLFLNLFALNKINSATIGILMYINPLFNFAVAFVVFGERVNHLQLLGYIIIIIALILFNYPNLKKIQASISPTK